MKNKFLKFKIRFLLVAFALFSAFFLFKNLAFALLDPSAVYCKALGYQYIIEETPQGQRGVCQLPNGKKVSAWKFLKGEAAKEFSFCEKQGYEIKTIEDPQKCASIFSSKCAVCILKDKSEVEVTKLMNLSFYESICGDKVCSDPENFKTCPKDCPSGGADGYCDGVKDGRCDPDCEKRADPDCQRLKGISKLYIIIGGMIVIIIAGTILIPRFLKKRKKAV